MKCHKNMCKKSSSKFKCLLFYEENNSIKESLVIVNASKCPYPIEKTLKKELFLKSIDDRSKVKIFVNY